MVLLIQTVARWTHCPAGGQNSIYLRMLGLCRQLLWFGRRAGCLTPLVWPSDTCQHLPTAASPPRPAGGEPLSPGHTEDKSDSFLRGRVHHRESGSFERSCILLPSRVGMVELLAIHLTDRSLCWPRIFVGQFKEVPPKPNGSEGAAWW